MKRSRYHRSVSIVLIGAICLGLAGTGLPVWASGSSGPTATVEHDGVRRTVQLDRDATVGHALALAHVALLPGHLLSAVAHRPIAGHDRPPDVFLNGEIVGVNAVITARRNHVPNHVVVVDSPDVIESLVTTVVPGHPPQPLPRVLHELWHPGQAGRSAQDTRGAISGELVAAGTAAPPSSPAPVSDKVVALTFDDGPWPDTGQFLQVLQQAGITATFCMIGRQVLAHPEWANAVVAAGMTLCNHTFNHNMQLANAPADLVEAEIQSGADAIKRVTGQAPRFYRAPGGFLSPLIEDNANRLGEQVLGWNVDPSDYRRPGPPGIVDRVMVQVRSGSIILLHDGGGDRSQTLAALPVIISRLLAAGYRFTTPDAIGPVLLN